MPIKIQLPGDPVLRDIGGVFVQSGGIGSSGIPAYDSLEEITSPSAGMVVKINGQEGEDRGVLAGDVLGVVTWAAAPNILAYSYENAVPITLLTFTDGTEIYTLYNELMEEPYTIDFAVYHGEQNANPIASLAFNEGYSPPASWKASSYNFGGRTVQAINDNSIQNAIKVQSPALPDKYYIYDEGWVEMVDVSATTAEEADVLDGEIFYKADGTQAEGTLVPLDISDADAAVGDVVASKTFYATSGGKKTGTMTDRGTVNTDIATKAQEVTIAAGKHSGSGKVKISAAEQEKIITANIKSGITMLGVAGKSSVVETSDATAVATDILSAKTGYVNGSKVTGTMVNRGTLNEDITTKAGTVTLQAGRYDGGSTIKISSTEQAKIIAGNIKKDITILGVTGTYEAAEAGSYSLTMYVATTPAPPGNNYLYLYYSLDNGLTYSQRVTATSGSPLVIEHVGQVKFKIVSEDGMYHPQLEFNGAPVFSESFFQGEAFSDNMVLTQNSTADLSYGYD